MASTLHSKFSSAIASFKSLSHTRRVVLLGLTAAAAMSIIWLMVWVNTPDFQVLYGNLAQEDAAAVVSRLKAQKIPFEIAAEGSTVLVPAERLYELRLDLASQGLPQGSGVGFEIFDNTKLGMTEFVQNVNYQRALQGELARTIAGFSEVESCRVHIVMPSQSLFLDQEESATASIVLKIREGCQLSQNQIQGIIHLVSSSVSRLAPKDVTVVDNFGKILGRDSESSDMRRVSSDQLEYQVRVEKNLENRIKTMLSTVLGPEKAIVRVSCLMDFRHEEKTAEQYQPDAVAVRSEQYHNSGSAGADASVVDVPLGVDSIDQEERKKKSEPTAGAGSERQSRVVNYEVSKVISHVVEPVGRIKRVSVAVVVDGTYRPSKNAPDDAQTEYVPRSQAELERMEALIKRVVNFDADRGDQVEVANMPFEFRGQPETEETSAFSRWVRWLEPLGMYSKYVIAVLILLFAYRLVVRPVIRWLTASYGGEMDLQVLKQLPMTVKELEDGYGRSSTVGSAASNRALEAITRDRDRSLQLMREWLKEGQAGTPNS